MGKYSLPLCEKVPKGGNTNDGGWLVKAKSHWNDILDHPTNYLFV